MSVTLTRNGTPLVPQTIVNVKPNDWFPIELTVQGSLVALKFAGGGTGATRLDLGASHQMASAAMRSALDIAEYNLRMVADPTAKQALQTGLSQLRSGLA